MNILLTGAFGNIGAHTIDKLLERGYHVRCFDIQTRRNEKIARRFKDKAEIVWGDLRCKEDVSLAVREQQVVIHLGFVIPTLSATGVNCEERPDWARETNVGGTLNLLEAMQTQSKPPKIIFASSLHVYGRTQDQPPPRRVEDAVHPVEHYAKHKLECERLVKESGLRWAILRLPATLPVRLILDRGMFDVPLDNRIEYAHGSDVGAALANAVECPHIWGKTLLIGGGRRCQFYYRDLVCKILEGIGLGMLPARAFSKVPYSTDWLDTGESQRLLKYQKHTLEDYIQDVRELLGWRLPFIRIFRSLIRHWLLGLSPYYQAAHP